MDALSLVSFADELSKIARVQTAVKQYRRAAQRFEEARRSILRNKQRGETIGGQFLPTKGYALHGTSPKSMENILEGVEKGDDVVRFIRPSPAGDLERAQYGPGVYWWRGFPQQKRYLGGLQDEGIATNLKNLADQMPLSRNIRTGNVAPWATVSGPHGYKLNKARNEAIAKLQQKSPGTPVKKLVREAEPGSLPDPDTAILDMATRAKRKTLAYPLADAEDAGLRKLDTALYHRARQRIVDPASNPSPTKGELIALYRRRLKGIER
jgi:hypothetical protein